MQDYKQYLSERAINILILLKQPTYQHIGKQKSRYGGLYVGTNFETIQNARNLSREALRKLMRNELYGIAGVFFENHEGHHSIQLVSRNATDSAMSRIGKDFGTMFSREGHLYRGKSRIVSKQQGLYIPPTTRQELEKAIDHEEYLFEKPIEDASLPTLEYVLKHSLELRAQHGNNWYPYFSSQSIARALDIDPVLAEETTANLTGLLCESHQTMTCRKWRKRFFLPSSKFIVSRTLLS